MTLHGITNLVTMLIVITCAAVFQELANPITVLNLKPLCLLGVVIYYSFRREFSHGLIACIVCGFLDDGMSRSFWGVTVFYFLLVALLCSFVLKKQMPANAFSCAVIGAVAGGIMLITQYIDLLHGGYRALPPMFVSARVLGGACFAAVTTLILALLIYRFDFLASNVGPEEHDV